MSNILPNLLGRQWLAFQGPKYGFFIPVLRRWTRAIVFERVVDVRLETLETLEITKYVTKSKTLMYFRFCDIF